MNSCFNIAKFEKNKYKLDFYPSVTCYKIKTHANKFIYIYSLKVKFIHCNI